MDFVRAKQSLNQIVTLVKQARSDRLPKVLEIIDKYKDVLGFELGDPLWVNENPSYNSMEEAQNELEALRNRTRIEIQWVEKIIEETSKLPHNVQQAVIQDSQPDAPGLAAATRDDVGSKIPEPNDGNQIVQKISGIEETPASERSSTAEPSIEAASSEQLEITQEAVEKSKPIEQATSLTPPLVEKETEPMEQVAIENEASEAADVQVEPEVEPEAVRAAAVTTEAVDNTGVQDDNAILIGENQVIPESQPDEIATVRSPTQAPQPTPELAVGTQTRPNSVKSPRRRTHRIPNSTTSNEDVSSFPRSPLLADQNPSHNTPARERISPLVSSRADPQTPLMMPALRRNPKRSGPQRVEHRNSSSVKDARAHPNLSPSRTPGHSNRASPKPRSRATPTQIHDTSRNTPDVGLQEEIPIIDLEESSDSGEEPVLAEFEFARAPSPQNLPIERPSSFFQDSLKPNNDEELVEDESEEDASATRPYSEHPKPTQLSGLPKESAKETGSPSEAHSQSLRSSARLKSSVQPITKAPQKKRKDTSNFSVQGSEKKRLTSIKANSTTDAWRDTNTADSHGIEDDPISTQPLRKSRRLQNLPSIDVSAHKVPELKGVEFVSNKDKVNAPDENSQSKEVPEPVSPESTEPQESGAATDQKDTETDAMPQTRSVKKTGDLGRDSDGSDASPAADGNGTETTTRPTNRSTRSSDDEYSSHSDEVETWSEPEVSEDEENESENESESESEKTQSGDESVKTSTATTDQYKQPTNQPPIQRNPSREGRVVPVEPANDSSEDSLSEAELSQGTPVINDDEETKSESKRQDSVTEEEDEQAGSQETYCICRQPGEKDMIGCDNDQCEIGWFHYKCVNMRRQKFLVLSRSKRAWFCPGCKELAK